MASSRRRFIDGDHTVARACGPLLTEEPFDFMPNIHIYRQRHRVRAGYFAKLPLNAPLIQTTEQDSSTVPAYSGTWKAKYKGVTSAGSVPYNATTDQVKTLLESIATIGAGSIVAVTGAFPNYVVEGAFTAHLDMGVNLIAVISSIVPAQQAVVTHLARMPNDNPVQSIRFQASNTAGVNSTGAVLVQETARQASSTGNFLYWDRVWANIPQSYVEYEAYNHAVQRMQTIRIPWSGTTDIWGQFQGTYRTFVNLAEYSEPLTATLAYSFCLTARLGRDNSKFYIPYRIIHYKDSFGNEVVYAVGTYGIAEGTHAERWMGDIWRVRNTIVTPY